MIVSVKRGAVIGAALVATLAPAMPVFAAAPHHDASPQVLYQGLNNPRGLAFGPGGALYVAEAGTGGTGTCVTGPEGEPVCFGTTGSVGRLKKSEFQRVITGLPSLAAEGGSTAIGPSDVTFGHGKGLVTVGLGTDPAVRSTVPGGDRLGQLYSFSPRSPQQSLRAIADVAGFEAATNPDGGAVDSNPQAVVYQGRDIVLTDAGGNALLQLNRNGNLETIAVFPQRQVLAPPFLGLPPGTMIPMDAVPTGVIRHGGAYYVAQLTGFPFPQGGARIYRVVPGQQPTIYADGLTNVIDLAFGPGGALYVLEIANNLLNTEPSGVLLKVKPGGQPEVLLDDLNYPGGLTIRGSTAYFTDCAVCPGTGRILSFKL